MIKKTLGIGTLLAYLVFTSGCASRLPMRDYSGRPLTKEAVQAKKSNSNFILYAIGGGALSFGASFFIGSLLSRSSDDGSTNSSTLWITAGAGTAAGMLLFGHAGKARDHNLAVLAARDNQKTEVNSQLLTEKERRSRIVSEREALLKDRERQEAERQQILEKLKKKTDN